MQGEEGLMHCICGAGGDPHRRRFDRSPLRLRQQSPWSPCERSLLRLRRRSNKGHPWWGCSRALLAAAGDIANSILELHLRRFCHAQP
uniref:Uncharacterized protein n=1 Tax=Aegilops tauschii TaxID=37682 RepID=M8BQ30_AEGTA